MNIATAIIPLLIQFLLRQIGKYQADTDFWLLEKDFMERAQQLVPEHILSPAGREFISSSFNALITIMRSGGELNNIRMHLRDGDWYYAYCSAKYAVEKAFNGKAE